VRVGLACIAGSVVQPSAWWLSPVAHVVRCTAVGMFSASIGTGGVKRLRCHQVFQRKLPVLVVLRLLVCELGGPEIS
jgi:hypothetical protein